MAALNFLSLWVFLTICKASLKRNFVRVSSLKVCNFAKPYSIQSSRSHSKMSKIIWSVSWSVKSFFSCTSSTVIISGQSSFSLWLAANLIRLTIRAVSITLKWALRRFSMQSILRVTLASIFWVTVLDLYLSPKLSTSRNSPRSLLELLCSLSSSSITLCSYLFLTAYLKLAENPSKALFFT